VRKIDIHTLRNLEKESESFHNELIEPVLKGEASIKEILGFELPKAKVYIPPTCSDCQHGMISLFSFMPLYDTVIFPLYSSYEKEKITDPKIFKRVHSCDPEEVALAAREGHVIPVFAAGFSQYDPKMIEPILGAGVPTISFVQHHLIKNMNLCSFAEGDCEKCQAEDKWVNENFSNIRNESCLSCLLLLNKYGLGVEKLISKKIKPMACNATNFVVSRNLDAVFQADCPKIKDSFSMLGGSQEQKAVSYILEGLRVTYTNDIPLQSYLELLDSKTTEAVRKTVTSILQDPYAKKYRQILNSKIFEVNQDVRDLKESRAAKFYEAISDLAVYGGSKFVEGQTNGYARIPKKGLKNISEWIASKALDMHARITKKDWTIAQLCRLECKFKACRTKKAI
jgi:hypothetical protein